jgi:hypothetical protein
VSTLIISSETISGNKDDGTACNDKFSNRRLEISSSVIDLALSRWNKYDLYAIVADGLYLDLAFAVLHVQCQEREGVKSDFVTMVVFRARKHSPPPEHIGT